MKCLRVHRPSSIGEEARYSVNIANVLYYIQLKLIESLVEKKFNSKPHLRVFRAFQALGYSNDTQIEEACLLSLKTARSIIMDLVIEGVLDQHDLNVNKGLYAYSIKISNYIAALREKIFKVLSAHQTKLNLEIKLEEQRPKVHNMQRKKLVNEKEFKLENHFLKKLVLASYQIDDLLNHFVFF